MHTAGRRAAQDAADRRPCRSDQVWLRVGLAAVRLAGGQYPQAARARRRCVELLHRKVLRNQGDRGRQGRTRTGLASHLELRPYLRSRHRGRDRVRNIFARRGGGLGDADRGRFVAPSRADRRGGEGARPRDPRKDRVAHRGAAHRRRQGSRSHAHGQEGARRHGASGAAGETGRGHRDGRVRQGRARGHGGGAFRLSALAAYAALDEHSRGRRHPEPKPAYRSEYQRDRDRIVHSTAFRRLVYKTQVFVNHEGDLYRTRLTHSLEVAQIARTIARALRLNEELSEALALAHDLGHTPFGHAGEEALNAEMAPYGGFSHNDQTLRILTHLEHGYAEFDGLNLTWEALEGTVK